MGVKSYKRETTVEVSSKDYQRKPALNDFVDVMAELARSFEINIELLNSDYPGVIDFYIESVVYADVFDVHFFYKKVVGSPGNQVCFLGFFLDLDTGDVLLSNCKQSDYFSLFNFFKLLEHFDIYITPEVLKREVEKYKFHQTNLKQFVYNLQVAHAEASPGGAGGSYTSRYLTLTGDASLEGKDETGISEKIRSFFNKMLNCFSGFEFREFMSVEDLPSLIPEEDTKSLIFNMIPFAKGVKKLMSGDVYSLIEEDFSYRATSGGHFTTILQAAVGMKEGVYQRLYALNLQDVLETSSEADLYLEEMYLRDIDAEELVDRIGLEDYVDGRFAGYSAQGFDSFAFKRYIDTPNLRVPSSVLHGVADEPGYGFQVKPSTRRGPLERSLWSAELLNTTFRKLQRVLRRMETL